LGERRNPNEPNSSDKRSNLARLPLVKLFSLLGKLRLA
jgi:hypothetical protein